MAPKVGGGLADPTSGLEDQKPTLCLALSRSTPSNQFFTDIDLSLGPNGPAENSIKFMGVRIHCLIAIASYSQHLKPVLLWHMMSYPP